LTGLPCAGLAVTNIPPALDDRGRIYVLASNSKTLSPKYNLGFTRKSAHQFFHTPSMILFNLAYFVTLREEPVDQYEPVETGYQSMQLAVEGSKAQTKRHCK
jgi:hypothetical protein